MAKLWYLGHSCFSVTIAGKTFVTDPFITPNPQAAHIDLASVEADCILVSHGHEDHTADLLDLANRTGALVLANFEITNWIERQGYHRVHSMNIGGAFEFEGIYVKMVQAVHSSSLPGGEYGGNPGGFVIHGGGDTIYFAGDTALTRDMELIAEEFVLDAAILPMGDNYTMGPSDSVRAAQLLQCNQVIGMHFDTFEAIQIDHKSVQDMYKAAGISLILPEIGDRIDI